MRDRELLVDDPDRRADLWRTLGRPGAVLVGHEIVGTWDGGDRPTGLDEQAERLAAHRGQVFGGYADR